MQKKTGGKTPYYSIYLVFRAYSVNPPGYREPLNETHKLVLSGMFKVYCGRKKYTHTKAPKGGCRSDYIWSGMFLKDNVEKNRSFGVLQLGASNGFMTQNIDYAMRLRIERANVMTRPHVHVQADAQPSSAGVDDAPPGTSAGSGSTASSATW
ncbi:Beta-glucosidase 1 [Clarias magur]|uniref:Beta-glucosidase 1 n=1 Tax=Clarias magur TaxID=1594786 RepID=A0A8J4TSY0_CLAMG|nr:Beta-glucosidase 1 [Clarias magur]